MASPMGPPLLPGYSLRVQLFAPNAYDSSDKPIRCFRVVASPDFTVEEFCQEASRIHQINYGTPLALKKVQDDQQFDITQSEILGNLFTTMSTIRCVQASQIPGARDSVAPTSALRFDPAASRKREREGGSRVNGSVPASSWKPNKRQRVSDPDEPLPSRENEEDARGSSRINGGIPNVTIIPNSQESVILGDSNGIFHNLRHVRTGFPSIPETVREIRETPSLSPPPSPALLSPYNERAPADHQGRQSTNHHLEDDLHIPSHRDNSRPLGETTSRSQEHVSNPRAKSASYHIQRATERGTSVSTAATSPLSVDRHPAQNGVLSTSRRRPESRPIVSEKKGKPNRSHDEDSIYDVIVSDEEVAVSKAKRSALKIRKSPNSGLPGMEWAKKKFNTLPNGSQRSSVPHEQTTSDELPLTPNSKEREERQKQAREAKNAQLAAAEAAEQRRREAEEARQAEETRLAEEERAKREEQERIEVENFQRGEADRKASIAKAARLKKEHEAREKKEAEEERRREEARIAKEKADEENRVEKERLAQEKAAAGEAERLREAEETAAEELRKSNEALKRKQKTQPSEESRQPKSSSPILLNSRGTPGSAARPQSSTPFIPGGRKSALKHSTSSQAMRSSSPAGSKASTDESSNGVGIEVQMPLPKPANRRVSFRDEPERKETPVKPPTRILPPKFGTPNTTSKPATPQAAMKATTPRSSIPQSLVPVSKTAILPNSAPRSSQSTPILPPGRQFTPIPPPRTVSSLARSISPTVQSKITPPRRESTPNISRRKTTPVVEIPARKSSTPVPAPRKSVTPVPVAKEKSKSVEPESEDAPDSEESSDDSGEDISNRPGPKKQPISHRLLENSRSIAKTAPGLEESESEEDVDMNKEVDEKTEEEIDEDETESHHSSPRDSRSPVIFSQHPKAVESTKPQRSASLDSDSSPESEANDEDQDEEDSDAEEQPMARSRNSFVDDEAEDGTSSGGDLDEQEEEDEDEDAEVEVPNSSPPVLPPHKHKASPKPMVLNQSNSKDSSSDEGHNTQEELDQQLTSSLYEARSTIPASSTPIPPPTSSAAPRPTMKVGVSLSSLNRNKSMLVSSSASQPFMGRSGQRTLQLVDDDESDESEEESDDDSSESAEDDAPLQKGKSKPLARKDVSSDSDSNSDSDSDSDEEDETKKIRDELTLEIAKLDGSDAGSFPSPKMYKTSTQQQDNDKGNKKKTPQKQDDKYITGYKFRMGF